MKKHLCWKRIIIFTVCFFSLFGTFACSKIGDRLYNDNKIHIVKSPFSSVKNVLIKNNKVLKENSPKDRKEFEILVDKKTSERILIKTNEMELEETNAGGIWPHTPYIVRMSSKHEYYNMNLEHAYNVNENDRIEFVYNGYGVIASYALKKSELDRLIKERSLEDSAYVRDIETYEQHEYNYEKKYKKVYNLDNEREIELEKAFDEIVIKNDNVIGIIIDEKYNKTYFKLSDEFKIINEISLREYKKLTKDMTKVYDEVVRDYSLFDNNVKFRIVREDNYMYIVDDNDKLLSQKYECDFIHKLNWDYASINEVIFVRKENDKYIFFSIEKDLFTSDSLYTYKNPLNIYNVDPTTAKYIIGANSCYARIDERNNALIFNSIIPGFLKVVPFVKTLNNEKYYFSNFAVYGDIVCGTYSREDDFQFVYGRNRKDYYPFIGIDIDNFSLYRILNLEYEKHIKVLDGKYEIIQNRKTGKIYVINNETFSVLKELPSIDIDGFGSFECGNKVFYKFSHHGIFNGFDLYDENLNLRENNGNFVHGDELIIYKKCDIEKNYECTIINSDGELINKYYCFFDDRSQLFLKGDDQKEYVIVSLDDVNGKNIHKNIVYDANCKDGREIPYFDLHYQSHSHSSCRISEKYYLFYDGNKSFIIDNNANVVKEFDAKLKFEYYNNIHSFLLDDLKNSDKMLYFFTYYKENKSYNLLLDYKLNTLIDVESKYQDDERTYFKVNFYDDCFSYVKDLQFYVLDYDKNIIFKSDIENFKK